MLVMLQWLGESEHRNDGKLKVKIIIIEKEMLEMVFL